MSSIEEQIGERLEAEGSALALLRHAQLLDSTTNRIIPFTQWGHIQEVIKEIRLHRAVICVKSKQIGISWVMALLGLHWCYKTGANVIEISSGERAAIDLLEKSRFILEHLPKHLQLERTHDGASLMSFTNHSRIHTLPSTPDAGIGETASLVLVDENEFHEYASENYANIRPTIDAGAHMVVVSTINPMKVDTHFRTLLKGALDGSNNFHPLFFDCFCVPGRDEEWYERTKMDYPLIWQFTHNYPRTLEEALSPITGRSVFDGEALSQMRTYNPVEVRQGAISIYLKPSIGTDYIAGADLAEGRGGDYSVLWIEGRQGLKRELSAVVYSNAIQPDTFAYMSYELLKEYHSPMVIGGADAFGGAFLKYLIDLGYPKSRIYCTDKDKEKLGYQETGFTQERDVLALEKTIRLGYLQIPFKPAILELLSMQYKEGKKSRAEVAAGGHDDLIFAMVKANFGWGLHTGNDKVTVSYSRTIRK